MKQILLRFKQNRRITAFDIAVFFRQFATLLSAGIPILQCCEMLEKSQVKTALRLLIYAIRRELLSGKDLYSSLHIHNRYFTEIICQLIKIGEHTGKLDMTLNMIAEDYEKQLAFKKRIHQALFYPCMITITALLVTVSMFLFVVPRFAELFSGTHVQLPALTRWIFFLSAMLEQHIYVLFFPILLFLPQLWSRQWKQQVLRRLTQLPVIKPLRQKIILAKFARNLAMTFSAGIPITDGLKLTMQTDNHIEFTHTMIRLRGKINSGMHLHQAMQSLPYFPDLMIQMVKIGEESGLLDHLLLKVAGFFESDIDGLLNQSSRLLEPLIMLVLGVLIGGLVIGMYLPIFKLGSVL